MSLDAKTALVLETARRVLIGCPVRVRLPTQVVGTQTPLPAALAEALSAAYGRIVDVVVDGVRRRKGGKFDIIIAFRGQCYAKHVAALSAMRTHVQAVMRPLVGHRLHRRRKPFYLPASTQCNANQDMLVWIGDRWRTLREVMPTPVREVRGADDALRRWATQALALSTTDVPLRTTSSAAARVTLRVRDLLRSAQ